MEELKKLEEVLEPDNRQKLFVVVDREDGEWKPLTLEHIYRSAASIKLHDGVSEETAVILRPLRISWFIHGSSTLST
jgi:hypothetical protein